jgi:hypothetical protein
MWDNICKHVIRHHKDAYHQRCNELKLHDSLDVIFFMIHSFHRHPQEYESFTTNMFLHEETKRWIHIFYSKCMHHFLSIKRCILRYVHKRRKSCNLVDLSYTPFTEYKPSLCLYVMDRGKKYTFTHSELHNIVENSLTNADPYMIANPLPIKNPYTGIPFSKENLYFLYLNMKHIPLMFRHFLNCQFSIHSFLLENESILRQAQICKRVRDIPKEELKQEMQDMVIEMCFYISFSLNIETHVLNITQNERESREMLLHYYTYMYSLNPYQRQCECRTLISKLKKMYVKPI